MAVVKKKEEVDSLLAAKKGVRRPFLFEKEIAALKKGEGLLIEPKEWSLKSTPSSYFYGKLRKNKTKVISCNKVAKGYLIVKL